MSVGERDRRVQRTRGLLHGALASLIHEKAYDGIVVKEIIARANVGRSTFYTHFRDKAELLESSIRDVLVTGKRVPPVRDGSAREDILQRTLRLFEHIEQHRMKSRGRLDVQSETVVHERLRLELARFTLDDLERTATAAQEGLPRELLAQFVASTFLVVLQWWLESEPSLPATEVNKRLAALLLPALDGNR